MGILSNYINSSGTDIGAGLVEKSYLIDQYPELARTFKFPGVWSWGGNLNGQLGDNTTTPRSSPVQTADGIVGTSSVAGSTNWKLITAGGYHTGAIRIADPGGGTLWSWGYNYFGQLGQFNTNRSKPTFENSQTAAWTAISYGEVHSIATRTDGTLLTWGYGDTGALGSNAITSRSSAVQTVSGGTNWRDIAAGTYHSMSIKTDGTLWLWGSNSNGQLGDNSITSRSSPVQTVSGGTNWKSLAATMHTAAIKTDGTLWLWGQNSYGQLGDNSRTKRSSPVQTLSGGTNWKSVACGSYITAAIKTDGTLWLWGWNRFGEAGDNSITKRSSPVQTVTGGTNWKSVACGQYYTASIKTDGSLWLWGYNGYGQLGDNSTTRRSSPVQTVSGGTNWKSVSCGVAHTVCIRDDSNDYL